MKHNLFAKQLNKRRMRIRLIADAYARAVKRYEAKIAAIEAAKEAA